MTAPLLLDIVLAFVLVAYAITGYRQGFVWSVFSMAGFTLGAIVGIWQLPTILSSWDLAQDGRVRVAALLLGVLLLGWVGQVLGAVAGNALRGKVKVGGWSRADAFLGAVVVTVVAAMLMWFLGAALRASGNPAVARAMSESRVLRAVGAVMPEASTEVFADFRSYLSNQGFPQVFAGLAPEPIIPVEDPDSAIAQSAAVKEARASVVKVTTQSRRCGQGQEGTGWVLGKDRIVTNAHVVAGADWIRVEGLDDSALARVVVFDPERDLAVLDAPGLDAPALDRGADLKRGESGAVVGFPLDGPYSVSAARVRQTLDARGYDIYGEERVVREIYSLNTLVQPGNSGGPLLDERGDVVGVIFAKSLDDDRTGYALTLEEAQPVLDAGISAVQGVSTGACIVG